MRRMLVLIPALAMMVGCGGSSSNTPAPGKSSDPKEAAKSLSKDIKDTAKDVVKGAADKIEAGKAELAKLAELATKEFPAIETKINGLSGDAKTKATDAFAALKKLIEDAKTSVGDSAKWKSAMEAITAKLAELKKQIGL